MDEEEKQLIWNPSSSSLTPSESNPMVSATVGRAMNTLLSARPKKLQDAISRLDSAPKIAPLGVSLEQSLWFLHKYVGAAAQKDEPLDEVIVPIIEHYLKFRSLKHGNQSIIILNWLFQDEILFQVVLRNLAGILSRKGDRYIVLGWCTLVRGLIDFETMIDNEMTNGIRENYTDLLKILCPCVGHLLSVVCNGSILQGEFELPTRVSVAAADVILSLTVALTRKDLLSGLSNHRQSYDHSDRNKAISLSPGSTSGNKVNITKKSSESSNTEMKYLLWDLLDELIVLVQKLMAWSRKSRYLHAKGLERVFKWLKETKQHYDFCKNEKDLQMMNTGVLLLSSCWKHYGRLMCLEDYELAQKYRELLDQYLSGIQFYADNHGEEPLTDKESGIETVKFFLNCLALLLGHLNSDQFQTALAEYGPQISQVITAQLQRADDDVVDGAALIFKATIFGTNSIPSKSSLSVTRQMDVVLPSLLQLLDKQDGAAKVVAKIIVEYCSISTDGWCLEEVLKLLVSGNVSQKNNALDVISDLIHISIESDNALQPPLWQEVANHLLDCLKDDEPISRSRASSLIALIDSSLVLPPLVRLIYLPNEQVQSSASSTVVAVLKNQKQKPETLCALLDCLSDLWQSSDTSGTTAGEKGPKLDADKVLKLLPEWSETVEDWRPMISPLMDKMFSEPSNAVMVRFLSSISEHLADAADLVFQQLLLYTSRQNDRIDEHSLFSHLCPLLIIKLLPLRVFNNENSSVVYGGILNERFISGWFVPENEWFALSETKCIASLLIKRAVSKFEFDDVRKLAAELCGRMHPQILIPVISSLLENASLAKDALKIKACLFAICTSLLVRGMDSYKHRHMLTARKTLETILLWPSVDGDDISKAQHGCIDCLALMICTELQAPKAFRNSVVTEICNGQRDAAFKVSVCTYVICQLAHDEHNLIPFKSDEDCSLSEATARISFRLCMANVLISASQKINDRGKKPLACKVLPSVIQSLEVIVDSEVRAACIQVLFSAVYHLKSAVLPYSSDLLGVAMKSIGEGSEKVKIAGAKLLASLMAGEDGVVASISQGLLDARALLQNASSSDPSSDLRRICQQLLICITPLS